MPHIHELYDFTASAYIVYQNKILLLKHKRLKTWIQPGGHIELDEHPELTLWREIAEETGIPKRKLILLHPFQTNIPPSPEAIAVPLPFDINVHYFDDRHQHIDMAYLLVSTTDRLKPADGETPDLKWFDRRGLDSLRKGMLDNVYQRCVFALEYVAKNT